MSTDESDHVLALWDRLFIVDKVVDEIGACSALTLPHQVPSFNEVRLSKKRILARSGSGFFSSPNLGFSWSPVTIGWDPYSEAASKAGFDIDPENPERIAIATCEKAGELPSSPQRLVIRTRSSDGSPFTLVASELPCSSGNPAIALERDKPQTLHYRTPLTPLVSGDGGKTWPKAEILPSSSVPLPEGGFAQVEVSAPVSGGSASASFRVSSGGVNPVLTKKGSFALSHSPGGFPLLRGAKGRFLFAHGGDLYASIDAGVSFKKIALPTQGVMFPAEVASRDGKTLWAVDGNWRVAMSPDGGRSWSLRYDGTPAFKSAGQNPRIYLHPYNDSSLVLHEQRDLGLSNQGFRIATSNGFTSADERKLTSITFLASAVGFLSSDAISHYMLNGTGALKGSATAVPPAQLPLPPANTKIWTPFPDILSVPSAPNTLFFGANGFGGPLRYEAYDVVTGTKRDVLPAVGVSIAGQAIAHTALGPRLRVVSESGQIRESEKGLVFTDLSPDPAFTPCKRRLLAVSQANPSRMATACLGSKSEGVNVTDNNGKDWTHLPAEDFLECPLTQIALTDSKVFVSCSESRRVFEVAR